MADEIGYCVKCKKKSKMADAKTGMYKILGMKKK